jgi:hypothetical protein
MNQQWGLSSDISKGQITSRLNLIHLKKHLSSSLPDYVFDPGERPAKLAQKRAKVGRLGYGDEAD